MGYIRHAQFAGLFYPASRAKLEPFFEDVLRKIEGRATLKAKGAIVPHAGYVYSGTVALTTLGLCEIPHNLILLGPNHTGLGSKVALSGADFWETPFGNVPCSKTLSRALLENCPLVELDDTAHAKEHSLEVELPILAYLNPKIQIVPLCLSFLTKLELKALGEAIGRVLRQHDDGVMIVVSSDMSHYVPEVVAKKLDALALEPILHLDAEGLYDTVVANRLTMCGFVPATALLFALKGLNIEARLTSYTTSAAVTHDTEEVVAYAGITFS